MSTRTPNLNLEKPGSDENYSISVFNSNADTIDTEVALRVKTADIINNLTSTATNKPLSAAQGKSLSDTKVNKSLRRMTNIDTDFPASDTSYAETCTFGSNTSGTKPFSDGFVTTYYWNENFQLQVVCDDDTDAFMFRRHPNASWTAWERLVTAHGKGALTIQHMLCPAYVTGSGRYIDFCVRGNFSGVTSGTVSDAVLTFFTEQTNGSQASFDSYTIYYVEEHGIWIEAHLSSSAGLNASKPCVVSITSITLNLT